MSAETEQAQVSENARECGYVKWFNNRAGYGFITVSGGPKKDDDVFVHHSALTTDNEQYKYLVQGEYVEFDWVETENDSKHEWQAGNVKGVNGGSLMCETRSLRQNSGDARRTRQHKNELRTPSRTRYRGGGPRSVKDEEGVEWLLVRKRTD
tara:strand:+ start:3788 stop:4243 length:456 start_codon:yes stop_codon:yes gene_type:complete